MPNRKNPFAFDGRPAYTGPHFMPFDLDGRATRHEANRQRVVTALLLELHVMSVKNIIQKNSLLSLRGAVSQSFEGHDGDQAAHCAPRQILVFTQTPSELLKSKFPERAYVLDCLFAETDILPANFNRADSRAERNGLNDGFLQAGQAIVKAGQHTEKLSPNQVIGEVKTAYSIYEKAAKTAFEKSSQELAAKIKLPGTAAQILERWQEQLKITGRYAETLQDSPGHARALDLGIVTGLIKLYEEI